jgi:hypothetical protein
MAPTEQQEVEWRATLERLGETSVRFHVERSNGVAIGMSNDAMLQFAFRWLRDKERNREQRELRTFVLTKWTFVAAVVAAIIGLATLAVTLAEH